jgi:hypothetical protein
MKDKKIIHGPIIRTHSRMVYSITLLSGHIVTNPEGFGKDIDLLPGVNESDAESIHRVEDYGLGANRNQSRKTVVG